VNVNQKKNSKKVTVSTSVEDLIEIGASPVAKQSTSKSKKSEAPFILNKNDQNLWIKNKTEIMSLQSLHIASVGLEISEWQNAKLKTK